MKNIFSKLGAENRTHASALIYKQQLAQSETLCREMNHRIKNSLAILNSFISLKLATLDNESVKEALRWVDGQIFSFTKFHELLMESSSNSCIPVKNFFEVSIEHIKKAYMFDERNISIEIHISDVLLHMNIAVPCIQIINELITNSIKHAFTGMEGGNIYISLRKKKKNLFELIVSDDGIGIVSSANFSSNKSLGTTILMALIRQINGNHSMQSDGGTKHTIVFNQSECVVKKITSL